VLLVDGTVIHKANGDRASSHSYTYAVCVCKGVHRPFVVASVLIVGTDIDLGLTALTATLFCSSYLLGVVMANTQPRLFMRRRVTSS
jgi:hypothetical protein